MLCILRVKKLLPLPEVASLRLGKSIEFFSYLVTLHTWKLCFLNMEFWLQVKFSVSLCFMWVNLNLKSRFLHACWTGRVNKKPHFEKSEVLYINKFSPFFYLFFWSDDLYEDNWFQYIFCVMFQDNFGKFHKWISIKSTLKILILLNQKKYNFKAIHSLLCYFYTGWVCAAGMCR